MLMGFLFSATPVPCPYQFVGRKDDMFRSEPSMIKTRHSQKHEMKENASGISHIDSTFHLQKSTRENKGGHDGLVHLTREKERKENDRRIL